MYGLITQICGLLILFLLALIYFNQEKIKSTEINIFSILLIISIVGTVVDIISTILALNSITGPILIYFCKLYLLYMNVFTLFMLHYVLFLFFDVSKKNKKLLSIFSVFTTATLLIVNNFLPLYNYINGIKVYTYGPLTDFTKSYIGVILGVIFIFIIINLCSKKTNLKKLIPLYTYILLLIIVAIFQSIDPSLVFTSFAIIISIFTMYFTIENPDAKLIEQLNIAKNQAEKASNAKTDFLSSISHEIRTPLNAIVGFSQELLNEDLSNTAKEEVKDIIDSSDTLLEIINGVLDISKIESNNLEIMKKEYDLKHIFNYLVELTKSRLFGKQIKFTSTYDESIPPVLYGDSARIKQIMVNLLTNATKYTNEGQIEFLLTGKKEDNKIVLTIKVSDTGKGISPEQKKVLFNKFERLGEDRNSAIEGTGLGLAITKKLVKLMDGEIKVESELNKGSIFTVILTQEIVEKKAEIIPKNINIDISNKKILIVDDNNLNLKVACKLISNYKCKITTSSSGFECLDLIEKETFDLIFLDDMMPGMTGTETLIKLREIENFKTPVVALTANALTEMKENYLSNGFDEFLAKPIIKSELHQILQKFLT